MFFTDATVHAGLDAMFPTGANNGRLSVHSAYSATGANLIGATTPCTWAAAAGRVKSLSAPVDISVPGAATVNWVGAWDSAGTVFRGMQANGGTSRSFQVDLTGNRFFVEDSGFVNANRVVFVGGTPPAPLAVGTIYFVVSATAADPDHFQVSLTEGGAAVDITAQHAISCMVSLLIPEAYAGAGTHRINSLNIPL